MQLFRGISVPHFSDNMDHADLNAAKVLKARANRSGLDCLWRESCSMAPCEAGKWEGAAFRGALAHKSHSLLEGLITCSGLKR
jgi:hypothetical protein